MNFKRAQEIFNSSKTISVFHNGTPIWIEDLNHSTQTALVKSNTKQMSVPVSELMEGH